MRRRHRVTLSLTEEELDVVHQGILYVRRELPAWEVAKDVAQRVAAAVESFNVKEVSDESAS